MTEKFIKALSVTEVLPGGMKSVEVGGHEIVICNVDGSFHAMGRRCGHMNAPLEKGTLDGKILTCPMHNAQFDVITGEALSGPVPRDFGGETCPPKMAQYLTNIAMLMSHIKTHDIRTYETKVESGIVWVAVQVSKSQNAG